MKQIIFSAVLVTAFSTLAFTQTVPSGQIKPVCYNKEQIISTFSYKLIDAPHNTFGYVIYDGDKGVIYQNSIPALQGNKGFETRLAAEKVAQLVIGKLKNGEMPPTVTLDEMKKLKAIN